MRYAAALALLLLVIGCGGGTPAPAKTETPKADSSAVVEVSFARDVQPIFAASCMPCHSGAADAKSKYDVSKYDGVMARVVAGQPDSSLLYTTLAAGKMPPAGKLDDAKLSFVQRWIAEGARNN
jgi:hypothetical protein